MEHIDFILEAAWWYLVPVKTNLTYAAARDLRNAMLVKTLPNASALRYMLKDIAVVVLTAERHEWQERLEMNIRRLERAARNSQARAAYYLALYRQTAPLVPRHRLPMTLQETDGFDQEANSDTEGDSEDFDDFEPDP